MIPIRTLIVIDFCCALFGAAIYFVFFDFLVEALQLPMWLVKIQLSANLLYAIFGIFIFQTKREHLFPFVVKMNFVYAGFCILMTGILWNTADWGSLFVLLEGLLLAMLATFEWRQLQRR